ncbi:MAG: WYL domain-containing protein, partial [Bacilli bacterium]|nr:WYL domain-containing protein [Bacilli bacterium]
FNLINRAIKAKRKCFIEYYSEDEKNTTKRTIHPYDLILLGQEWGVASTVKKTRNKTF